MDVSVTPDVTELETAVMIMKKNVRKKSCQKNPTMMLIVELEVHLVKWLVAGILKETNIHGWLS